MKTNKKLYREELKSIKELYKLGLISHVEKISQDIRAKFLYITQKRDSE